jgi:hypothetical protein
MLVIRESEEFINKKYLEYNGNIEKIIKNHIDLKKLNDEYSILYTICDILVYLSETSMNKESKKYLVYLYEICKQSEKLDPFNLDFPWMDKELCLILIKGIKLKNKSRSMNCEPIVNVVNNALFRLYNNKYYFNQYKYMLSCGTGTTTFLLTLYKNNTFTIYLHKKWMGEPEIKHELNGTYTKNKNYYFLLTDSKLNFELVLLSEKQSINIHDCLFEDFIYSSNCGLINNTDMTFDAILSINIDSYSKHTIIDENLISIMNCISPTIKLIST